MIRRDTDYAFRVLEQVACQGAGYATARYLSVRQGVPEDFAHKILRKLVCAGILQARPGKQGGFILARPAREVSMLDVIQAVQGSLRVKPCSSALGICPRRPVCRVSSHWGELEEMLIEFLEATTLADIMESPSLAHGAQNQVGGTVSV